jgi:CxxC-x17-CxxC domain-containing protein
VSPFADRTLSCRDCGKQFTFTAGEQEFYQTRGFSDPTRCADCRAARKSSQTGGGYGDRGSGRSSYSSSGYSGSASGSSSRSGSGDSRSGGTKQMYKVKCANCGIDTEVPFEPRSGRPVYCRDCYQQMGGGNRR